MYEIRLSPQAERFYRNADRPLAKKLVRCFERMQRNPHSHPNIKPLTGPLRGHWRFRIGDYRIVYRIDEHLRVVFVVIIAHRREVYR